MKAAASAELSSSSRSISIDGRAGVGLDVVGLVAEPLEPEQVVDGLPDDPGHRDPGHHPEQDDLLAAALNSCSRSRLAVSAAEAWSATALRHRQPARVRLRAVRAFVRAVCMSAVAALLGVRCAAGAVPSSRRGARAPPEPPARAVARRSRASRSPSRSRPRLPPWRVPAVAPAGSRASRPRSPREPARRRVFDGPGISTATTGSGTPSGCAAAAPLGGRLGERVGGLRLARPRRRSSRSRPTPRRSCPRPAPGRTRPRSSPTGPSGPRRAGSRGPPLREQLVVRALLHQLAVVQHHDQVGVADRGQAVGDHERGAAHHQVVERVEDHGLGLGVDRRGRLVEDQDRRVADEGARDADALALAARELRAALAELGLVARRAAPR